MPRGDPKVMMNWRLPALLVLQVQEAAEAEAVSVTSIVERALERELDESRQRAGR